MSSHTELPQPRVVSPAQSARISVGQFAERHRGEMIALSTTFSYFCATVPLSEEDVREYLEEPIAALPPAIGEQLPKVSILLVPYLEKGQAKSKGRSNGDFVSDEKPPESRQSLDAQLRLGEEEVLLFALKEQEVAEYHYRLYHHLAMIVGNHWTADAQSQYTRLLREELNADVHGEVDEDSWRLKQALRRRQVSARDTKAFRDYARQSFIDTLTLYLHGICCDIDVETGPRQLPSRHLKKRLLLFHTMYPPPKGYAVFPDELKKS